AFAFGCLAAAAFAGAAFAAAAFAGAALGAPDGSWLTPWPASARMPVRCSTRIVRMRAMSRFRSRINTGFWSCRIAFRKRRLKISSCSSRIRVSISSSVMSRIFSAFSSLISAPRQILPLDELRLDRQLARAELHGLFGQLRADSLELEEHAPGLHDGHPEFGRALAFSHSRLRRLHRHRLVREDANPHLAAALDEARDRHARGLDLAIGDPRRLERLQSELSERHGGAAVRHALAAPAHLLPVFDPLRYEHDPLPCRLLLRRGARLAGRRGHGRLLLL